MEGPAAFGEDANGELYVWVATLTREMMFQLSDLIRLLAAKEENRVIVVQGRGTQFCRGRDGRGENREGYTPHDVRTKMMGAVLGVYEAINAAPIPVIARVHAPAIGFGAALAGGCDITLASDAATFGFTEIKHGIPPTLAMSAVMSKVPAKALAWLIYSGEVIGAEQAMTFGLVSLGLSEGDVRPGCGRLSGGIGLPFQIES